MLKRCFPPDKQIVIHIFSWIKIEDENPSEFIRFGDFIYFIFWGEDEKCALLEVAWVYSSMILNRVASQSQLKNEKMNFKVWEKNQQK